MTNVLESNFKVLKILGHGSYGKVYLCKCIVPKRNMTDLVAVKRIECDNMEEVNEFLKEIVEIRDLDHPNIVKYYEGFIDQVGNRFFVNIVMEYLPGFQICDILEFFDDKNKEQTSTPSIIPERFLIHILSQMVDALYQIHEKGIIHRDISTNNIMVLEKNDGQDPSIFSENKTPKSPVVKVIGNEQMIIPSTPKLGYSLSELVYLPSSKIQFKLLDFGFVTRKLSEQTLIESYSVGTPDYQAPELLTRKPYNQQIDIFSLGGVILNFAMSKQAHAYAILTSSMSSSKEEEEEEEKEETGNHPLFDLLYKERGYSIPFLTILFKMLEIDPEKRIKTSELKSRIKNELLDIMYQKEKESFEKNRIEKETKIRMINEKVRNISVLEKKTIVSVNKSFHLSLWNWKEHKKVTSKSTIMNAHSWTITDIMSLSPGCYSSDGDFKHLIVSGGSKINILRIDGNKMLGNNNNNNKKQEEETNFTTTTTNKFYDIIRSFKSSSRIEVVCPIFTTNDLRRATLFSSGSLDSTIEVWDSKKNQQEPVLSLTGHKDSVGSICSFLKGSKLASGSKDRNVRIWDLSKNGICQNVIRDSKFISRLHYYEDKNLLAFSNSYGMYIRFYDLRVDSSSSPVLFKNLKINSIALTQFITGFEFVGEYNLVAGDNLRINCFDIRNLSSGGIEKCWVKKIPVNDIMLLEEELFATCDRNGMIRVMDARDGSIVQKFEEDVGGMFESRTCICCL